MLEAFKNMSGKGKLVQQQSDELETLIRALIRKADACLRQQIDDVRQQADGAQSHDQNALADAS